jgi:hypothetical protein
LFIIILKEKNLKTIFVSYDITDLLITFNHLEDISESLLLLLLLFFLFADTCHNKLKPFFWKKACPFLFLMLSKEKISDSSHLKYVTNINEWEKYLAFQLMNFRLYTNYIQLKH